jgi:Heparinase II/III-like protein/Heparinase II/III N-terminus
MHSTCSTSVVSTLTPVVCVIDHLYRDPEVADAACRGEYSHGGVTLHLGSAPDWISDGLPEDEEWRIEWVKLYEGLDLAAAFERTGDLRYIETWQDLVQSFCEQVPVGHELSEVSARRIQNWLYAWQRFERAAAFDGLRCGLADKLAERLSADVQHLRHNLTNERNHRTLELYAVFVAALALPQAAGLGKLVRPTVQLLTDNLLTDIWADGVHRECSTDYHCIVVRSFVGVVANAQQFGFDLPDEFYSRLNLACDFMMHAQRPDGTMPSFSDGDTGDFRALLQQAGTLLHRDDLLWVGSGGVHGVAPAQLDATFPTGGYVMQRSGWGVGTTYAHERWLMLDCGPIGDGGHGHYDQLSVEIAAGGRSIVVDPGRYTYAAAGQEAESWRHRFKGTEAHNTVTVDQLDQTPYRRGKPKGPTSVARLIERSSSEGLDVIVAEVVSPSYSAIHTRRVAFVGREFWLIHDQLRDVSAHDYCLRWHLAPEALGALSLTRMRNGATVSAPGFTMIVTSTNWSREPDFEGQLQVEIESGWVSPTYGIKDAAPVVTARSHGANVDFVTLIFPSKNES